MLVPRLNQFITISGRHLSYFHQLGKEPLQYLTVGQLFENTAKTYGDREAVISVHQQKKFTYGEALEKCDRLAAGLLNIGLQKGDRLGLWCPNLAEWFLLKFACARAGLILVALNPSYQIPEIEYCINKVGIKCMVCPDKVKKMKFYEMLNTLGDLENKEPGKITLQKVPSLKSVITISNENLRGTYNYEEIEQCSDTALIEKIKKYQDSILPDDIYSILFTSGTTGKPKAAMVSHFSHFNNSKCVGERTELGNKHHKICMMVPFFHAFGINITVLAAMHYGSTVVLPSATYNPSDNLTAIKNETCTVIHGTPTMHLDLITQQSERNEDISPDIAVTGGSLITPQQCKDMFEILKLKTVKNLYGLTETTCMVFTSKPGDGVEKSTGTVGCVADHTEVKVVGEDGRLVPFGASGELCVRSYSNMIGYWEDEAKAKAGINNDGWFRTGDICILNEDGYAKIIGRLKDMIIRGGENIYPKEIEDILMKHNDILDVQVIGLPHERLGEEVCACIRLKKDTNLTMEDLVNFCKGKMANFKIPTHMKIVDSFPRTVSGKIQKYLLVDRFSKRN